MPRIIKKGMFFNKNGVVTSNENNTPLPIKKYESEDAVMAEINNGIKLTMVRSSINTSITNTIPAIGALKIPAIAPADPQPIRSIVVL